MHAVKYFGIGGLDFNLTGGVGLGQNYSIALLQLGQEVEIGDSYYLGATIDYMYYSKYIINVPWTDRAMNLGWNTTLGVYISKDLPDWEIKVGFSSLLGPNFRATYYIW